MVLVLFGVLLFPLIQQANQLVPELVKYEILQGENAMNGTQFSFMILL